MTNTTEKATAERRDPAVGTAHTVVERAAGLSDEVLTSVEAGQRAAIDAVRTFVDTVDEAFPPKGDHHSRRETVIDAALDMADRLVTTQYKFLRSVVRSADRSLRRSDETDQS
ncbi:hypothetical protein [Mycobacterium kyogaense]|uniref:hypothetical protein n=1 Tax=Mycobacterium kyogaense TaxID=2212479 RepID=UPI001F08889D|nr:hypothetical protein [Mycobacterium kyogaense]